MRPPPREGSSAQRLGGDAAPSRSFSLEINQQNLIVVTEKISTLGNDRAIELVAALFPTDYSVVTLGVGHELYGVPRPRDLVTLLEVLLACNSALEEPRPPNGARALLARVLEIPWTWWDNGDLDRTPAFSPTDLARLKGAVAAYYQAVQPKAPYQQVPRLLLACGLESARDSGAAAAAFQSAVQELPRDDPLRLRALERVYECRMALGDEKGALEAKQEAGRVFYSHLPLPRDLQRPPR